MQKHYQQPARSISIETIMHKIPEAAKKLGMSERFLWEQIREKKIGVIRTGRYVRITNAQIEQFIAANTVHTYDPDEFAKNLLKNRKH